MGPSGPPVSAIRPSPCASSRSISMCGGLVLGGIEEGAGGELHEVLPAALVAGEQRQRAGRLRARLIGAVRAAGRWPAARSPKSTCSVQPTIGWMPASASLSENSSAPNRLLVSVSPTAGKPRAARQLGELGDGDGAFQQRVGRVHLEVHELRPLRADSAELGLAALRIVVSMACIAHANRAARKGCDPLPRRAQAAWRRRVAVTPAA